MPRNVILTHGDTDGVAAAALAKAALGDADVYFTHPAGLLEDLREFASAADCIVVLDISLDEAHLPSILREFQKLGKRLLYIDHHPLPNGCDPRKTGILVVHEEGPCTAELVFKHLKLSWEMSRVALYGAIGDYALGTPWVREAIRLWDIKTLFFEAGVLVLSLDRLGRNYDEKRKVVEMLSRNVLPSKIPGLVRIAEEQAEAIEKMRLELPSQLRTTDYIAYVLNPRGSLGIAAFYAAVLAVKPVGAAFRERGGWLIGSLRARDGKIDLNAMLRKVAPCFGGHGGGHRQAAGVRIPSNVFKEFVSRMNEVIARQLKRTL